MILSHRRWTMPNPSPSLPPLLSLLLVKLAFFACLLNVTFMYFVGLSSAFVTICLSDRLWFDELISLWLSVQNLPSWEVVSSLICWLDRWVSPTALVVRYWLSDAVTRLVKPAKGRSFQSRPVLYCKVPRDNFCFDLAVYK